MIVDFAKCLVVLVRCRQMRLINVNRTEVNLEKCICFYYTADSVNDETPIKKNRQNNRRKKKKLNRTHSFCSKKEMAVVLL